MQYILNASKCSICAVRSKDKADFQIHNKKIACCLLIEITNPFLSVVLHRTWEYVEQRDFPRNRFAPFFIGF